MNERVVALNPARRRPDVDAAAVLNALATPVLVVDEDGTIGHVNVAGEQFFKTSAAHLEGQRLADVMPAGTALVALIEKARRDRNAVIESGVTLDLPHTGTRFVNVQASPLTETGGRVVVAIQERSIADAIDRQLTHRGAARSVTAMAAMLAHEVKNPLSGIRGAAQLLEQNGKAEDAELTRLICAETDRICALVDRMELFSDDAPLRRKAVNIHQVIERVHQLARNGFGGHLRFVANYDPSLPPVLGDHDRLVQVFLNLVKNAAEAAPANGGEIVLSTAYRHGGRFAVPWSDSRVHLPLVVSVQDNGSGIPADLQGHLFDPFVTTKPKGTGLGLALVAKIIGDHGGVIEFESRPRRTVFRVMLPVATAAEQG